MTRFTLGLVIASVLIGCNQESAPPLPTVGVIEAAKTGNIGQIKAHITHGSKLDIVDDEGKTALDYASANDDTAMYELLWETGAFKEPSKQTPKATAQHAQAGSPLPTVGVIDAAKSGNIAPNQGPHYARDQARHR